MQVRLVTPVAHRVPEAGGRERLSIIGDQKCQVFRRCRRNGGKQVRMSRDIDLDRVPVLVLGLREPDPTIANMLQPEANGILAASAGIEQQIEREARFATDRVAGSVLFDLVVGPRMMTGRRILDLLDAEGRVLWGEFRFLAGATAESQIAEIMSAGRAVGRQAIILKASTDVDIDVAFEALIQGRVQALLVTSGPLFVTRMDRLVAFAARHALPAMYFRRELVDAGGLVSYASNTAEGYRQMGIYAGRILKGEKPSELPVVQPTKYELVINLKTAKALGLEVPPTLLARADEVIE
jgi:hypothetical protein